MEEVSSRHLETVPEEEVDVNEEIQQAASAEVDVNEEIQQAASAEVDVNEEIQRAASVEVDEQPPEDVPTKIVESDFEVASHFSNLTFTGQEPWILEKILVVVKPDAVGRVDKITKVIKSYGFQILQQRKVTLSPEQASELYEDQYGELHFPLLVTYMSSAPIIAMCLIRRNAFRTWKIISGPANPSEARRDFPESLRARFGHEKDEFRNAVDGSESPEKAIREIHFFFPEMIIEPTLTGDSLERYLMDNVNTVLVEALTQLCRAKPADPVIWLADWLLAHNPNKPITDKRTALAGL